jgi:hypothetical protein
MGRKDPREALIASTSVLPIEIPTALTPWPNMMLPNPHMNPATRAITTARVGASPSACTNPGNVIHTMITGITKHETHICSAQTFSHDHRLTYLIGSVNVPFNSPDRMAIDIPRVKFALVPFIIPSIE